MKFFFWVSLMTLIAASSAPAAIITQWDFEGDVLTPSVGNGSASNTGGTSSAFASGNAGGPGWNTSNYPAQGTASGTAGAVFLASTAGFQDITVSLDHRSSGTASRWAQFEYTTDGGANWIAHSNNAGGLSPHDFFYSFSIDLGSLSTVNDNADFGFRVVSIFSPDAFDQNASLADFAADSAYMRANAQASFAPGGAVGNGDYSGGGTWRFDNVILRGSAVPEPSSLALVAITALGGMLVRFRNCLQS